MAKTKKQRDALSYIRYLDSLLAQPLKPSVRMRVRASKLWAVLQYLWAATPFTRP